MLIDRYGPGENAGYPTLCKGRFEVEGSVYHAIEEPVSLNTMDILPELQELGISAVKIEGRQRSPALAAGGELRHHRHHEQALRLETAVAEDRA